MRRRLAPVAGLIAVLPLALALSACSGSSGTAANEPAGVSSASSAPAPAPSASAPESAAPAPTAPAPPPPASSAPAPDESPAGPVKPAQLEYLANAVLDQITFGAGSLDEQLVTIAMSPVMRQVTGPLGIATRMDEKGQDVVFTMSADGYACSLSVQDKPRKSLSIDCGKSSD